MIADGKPEIQGKRVNRKVEPEQLIQRVAHSPRHRADDLAQRAVPSKHVAALDELASAPGGSIRRVQREVRK